LIGIQCAPVLRLASAAPTFEGQGDAVEERQISAGDRQQEWASLNPRGGSRPNAAMAVQSSNRPINVSGRRRPAHGKFAGRNQRTGNRQGARNRWQRHPSRGQASGDCDWPA
jgi:hypothetical protein